MTTTSELSTVDLLEPIGSAIPDCTNGAAIVILRWDKETGWAWLAHGRGALSRFAGFMRLSNPNAVPRFIHELGWELLGTHDIGCGLFETEILVPLKRVRT